MNSLYTLSNTYLIRGLLFTAILFGVSSCDTSRTVTSNTPSDGIYYDPSTDVKQPKPVKEEENLVRIGGKYFQDYSEEEVVEEEAFEYSPSHDDLDEDYIQWGENEGTTIVVNNYADYGYSPYVYRPFRRFYNRPYFNLSFGWGNPFYNGFYTPWVDPFYSPYYGFYNPFFNGFYGYGIPVHNGFYGNGFYNYNPYIYGKGVRGGAMTNLQRTSRRSRIQNQDINKVRRDNSKRVRNSQSVIRNRGERENSNIRTSNIRTRNNVKRNRSSIPDTKVRPVRNRVRREVRNRQSTIRNNRTNQRRRNEVQSAPIRRTESNTVSPSRRSSSRSSSTRGSSRSIRRR